MKKRIVISIALLMILCLALAGCAQRDNHAGATSNEPASESHDSGIGNPDISESEESTSGIGAPGDETPENQGEDIGSKASGEYTYSFDGTDLVLHHNIDDYIEDKEGYTIFRFDKLADDIGWKYIGYNSGYDYSMDEMDSYMLADEYSDDKVPLVSFQNKASKRYESIYYVYIKKDYAYDHGFSHIAYFTRTDLTSTSGGGGETYWLNTHYSGSTISRNMAIMACYLLENIHESDTANPLENLFGGPGPYNF